MRTLVFLAAASIATTMAIAASATPLLRPDEKLLNGEEGMIAADCMCMCQDPTGMHAAIGNVAMTGTPAAKADVAVQFMASAGKPLKQVMIDLAFESGAWRLHDIHGKEPEGTAWYDQRAALTREIAELSAHH